MSYKLLHPETRETPAEYSDEPSCPVTCAECGQVWDEDDDSNMFETVDVVKTFYKKDWRGQTTMTPANYAIDQAEFCKGECVQKARNAAWLAVVRCDLPEKVGEVLEWLEEQYKVYRQDGGGGSISCAEGNPYVMIDDVLARLCNGFQRNPPETGWRDGAMLSEVELSSLLSYLKQEHRRLIHEILWQLGEAPEKLLGRKPYEWDLNNLAVQLVRVSRQIESLETAIARTCG